MTKDEIIIQLNVAKERHAHFLSTGNHMGAKQEKAHIRNLENKLRNCR